MKKEQFEAKVGAALGHAVELTLRGGFKFTLSFEGDKPESVAKIKTLTGSPADFEHQYDAETDATYCWFELQCLV